MQRGNFLHVNVSIVIRSVVTKSMLFKIKNKKGKFLDVDIRWPGGKHDAKVFANSRMNKAMQ